MSASSSRMRHPSFLHGFPVISLLIGAVFWGLLWWPLKFFAQIGLTSNLIGIIAYAMVAIVAIPILWLQRKAWCNEWMLLLLIGLFFFSAVQMFIIGLLGEYIGSIHTHVRNLPHVVEMERINFD